MLRGKSQDALLTDLMEKRAFIQQKSTELLPAAPLIAETLSSSEKREIIRNYWKTTDHFDDSDFKQETPSTACSMLKTLGNPPDWPINQSFAEIMQPLYEHVNKTIL